MDDYEFTLRFTLPIAPDDADALVERLGDAGCDDALIGVGQPGRVALDFTRTASSARQAIHSAIADVRSAVPDAGLVEVGPDLVGTTEVAALVGCSRQNIRQLMLAAGPEAPAPIHEGTQAIWHLARILDWLVAEKGYAVDTRLRELAEAAMQVNLAVESRRLDATIRDEIRALLA